MCMANPLDQFTTYVSQNPDSLTGSVARRSTVNPVARRLTGVLDAASTTEPVLNDLVTIVDTTAVNEDTTEPTTVTIAADSVEALKVSIFNDYIQPFINSQSSVSAIDDIADVVVTEPTAGQVLKYNGTTWVNGIDATVTAGTGTGFTLSAETTTGGANIVLTGTDASTDLVKIAAGTNITIARTDASTITINSTATSTGGGGSSVLSTLGDVQLSTLASGQVLKYNGSKWVNGTDLTAAAGATALTGLTDVLLSGPTTGQVLKYDGSKWVNAVDATATAGGGGVSYSISAETVSNVTTLRLTGSDATTDNVKFAAGSGISILRTDADTITLASTYAYTLPQATTTALGGVKVDGTSVTINATTGVISATAGTGTVTSVSGTGTIKGLTLTGTVTTSGSLTLGGTLTLASSDVTTALGFTPYNATNPNSYITIGSVSGTYAPLDSPAFTNNPTAPTQLTANNSTRLATTAFVKAQGYTSNVGDATLAGTQTFTGAKSFTGGITSSTYNFDASTSIGLNATNIALTPSSAGIKLLIGSGVGASTLIGNNGGVAAYEFNLADYRCSVDISRTLGTSNFRWGQIYSSSASINTSDERSKTDIVDCPLGLDFILDLEPKFFKIKVASNIIDPTWTPDPDYVPGPGEPLMQRPPAIPVPGVRDHSGLIAQNVRAALDRAGIADWAGWGLDDKDDPNSRQHLRYESFIAPLIKSVHQVCDRLDAMEQRLSKLENP